MKNNWSVLSLTVKHWSPKPKMKVQFFQDMPFYIGKWCNGNTRGFESLILSSSLGFPTNIEKKRVMNMKDEILKIISMKDILDKYNIPYTRNMYHCPFHKDKNASAKMYDNSFYCFSCNKTRRCYTVCSISF